MGTASGQGLGRDRRKRHRSRAPGHCCQGIWYSGLIQSAECNVGFRQGRTITVNSSGRAIYDGRREDLLRQNVVKRDIMAGSPVQRIVSEALQYITPLNLSDPTSTHFKSTWCETLHDITRFCHEKSVSEMFNYGTVHHFDKATAKRLVGDVPLEWWVIDLADGFRPGLDSRSKTVRVEDIVSLPMQAIWRGISAFPWEGPPPISARGFGEIIFQSAMRPDLDPSVPSGLTTKNYFLVSENFCNLSVRLGYHYAMIESYLSDLLTESYVTFRFKGGAADMRRKAVRAKLLADILLRYDFRVELRSDALLARLKKQPMDYLEKRLQIFGYLTLHARQLDMVMNQPQAVEQYREKFLKDIEEMLARERIRQQLRNLVMNANSKIMLVDDERDFLEIMAKFFTATENRLRNSRWLYGGHGPSGQGQLRCGGYGCQHAGPRWAGLHGGNEKGSTGNRGYHPDRPRVAQCGDQRHEKGAFDYCLKPVDFDELLEKILLAKEKNMST